MKNLLVLFMLFSFHVNLMAQKVNYVGTDLPNSLAKKVYSSYKESYKSRARIDRLTSIDKIDGVYTFRVAYCPHNPERVFIIYKNNIYTISSLGFFDPQGVIAEVWNILSSIKCDCDFSKEVYGGIYAYLYEEYGLDYGRHITYEEYNLDNGSHTMLSKPYFNNDSEKEKYFKSKIRYDSKDLDELCEKISKNRLSITKGLPYYIQTEDLNDEESILLMKKLSTFKACE